MRMLRCWFTNKYLYEKEVVYFHHLIIACNNDADLSIK